MASIRRRRSVAGLLMTAPAIIAVSLFFFVPLVLVVWISLHRWPILGANKFLGIDNFVRAFNDEAFISAASFTALYTVIITPILFVIGLTLALLVRRQRRGVGIFRTVFFLPVVIGLAAASYIWVWLVQSGIGPLLNIAVWLGLVDSNTNWLASTQGALGVIVVMITWKAVGMQMLLFMAGLQSIPVELEDAAKVDGASRLQTMLYVFLPLLRPTIVLILVFGVSHSLLAFDQFYIVTGGGPAQSTITAVFSIYRASFVSFDLGYGSALSLIALVVLAIVSAVQLLLLRNSDND
ncbi:carbohydrate ABC transporter permease [Glaciibacter superstes]|uniref:carbohydrate ABC transporter permease n=1 Tax=Glaciibacter superstes TaxID=501023 RepID=UPI0004265A41|nr:sugar ABC transporter permease [Glaciibacter superstes]